MTQSRPEDAAETARWEAEKALHALHVTEGRAYHPGDTVVLRCRVPLDPHNWERLRGALDEFERRSSVHVLLLSNEIEVVEPKEVLSANP